MPYQMYWYIENRVIGTRLYGDVTEDDLVGSVQETETYITMGQSPLLLLIDNRDITKFPHNFKKMLDGMREYQFDNSALVLTLLVSENALVNFFGVLVSKVFRIPLKPFKDMDAANTYLIHNYPDLEALLQNNDENTPPRL